MATASAPAPRKEPTMPVSRALSDHSAVSLWSFSRGFPEWMVKPVEPAFKFESQLLDVQMGQPWTSIGYSQKLKMSVYDITLHDKILPSYMVLHVREHEDYIPVVQERFTGFKQVSEEALQQAYGLLRDSLASHPEGQEREVNMELYTEAIDRVDLPGTDRRIGKYRAMWHGYLGPTFYLPRRVAEEFESKQKRMLENFGTDKV